MRREKGLAWLAQDWSGEEWRCEVRWGLGRSGQQRSGRVGSEVEDGSDLIMSGLGGSGRERTGEEMPGPVR